MTINGQFIQEVSTAGEGYLMKTAVGENLSIASTNTVSGHLSYRMV